MHPIVVALAAAVVAASQPQIEADASTTKDMDPELKLATKKADRHRSIHTSIDLRMSVIFVAIWAALIGLFKDGNELIGHNFMVAHVWLCAAGILAASVTLAVRLRGLNDNITPGDLLSEAKEELAILQNITRRKKVSYNLTLVLAILDVVVVATAITLK